MAIQSFIALFTEANSSTRKLSKASRAFSLATALPAAILACSSQSAYAEIGPTGSLIKLPGSTEMDVSLRRLNDAWSAIRSEDDLRTFMDESKNSLSIAKQVTSDRLETVKFQHYYNGLEVVGSMAMHQNGLNGSSVLNRLARIDVDTRARLSSDEAIQLAGSVAGRHEVAAKPELKILAEAEGSNARLVYWVELNATKADGARDIVVDAHTGEVLANVSKNIELAPINVFSAKDQGTSITENTGSDSSAASGCTVKDLATGKTTEMDATTCENLSLSDLPPSQCQVILNGNPLVVQPQNCSAEVTNGNAKPGADASAIRAAKNTEAVLSYYLNHHKRNSYDNHGAATVSIVHGGLEFDNAYWNTQQQIMVYGDGDGKTFGDFTTALDVAGHEMTHGVVSQTAKLLGMGESGALNEAFADFFGKMIANDGDWAIGRKLFLDQSTAKGVRDLANPGNLTFCAQKVAGKCVSRKPFPSKISEKMVATGTCDSSNDNCYVHTNSTIPSHASYLVVQALGAEKAETLYYAALTQSLTSTDTITTAARSIKATCPKVLDAAACAKVTAAYAQAGL